MSEFKKTAVEQNDSTKKSLSEIFDDYIQNGLLQSDWDSLTPLQRGEIALRICELVLED